MLFTEIVHNIINEQLLRRLFVINKFDVQKNKY